MRSTKPLVLVVATALTLVGASAVGAVARPYDPPGEGQGAGMATTRCGMSWRCIGWICKPLARVARAGRRSG